MTDLAGVFSRIDRKGSRLKVLALAGTIALAPFTAVADTDSKAQVFGTPSNLPLTLSGSYLSGRLAGFQKDYGHAAAFYEETLAADPTNTMLLERTFLLKLANGDVEEAVHYAGELENAGLQNFLAQLALGGQHI
ncbi:MAG: hypothetical protein AAFN16_26750, partial [Pseudomonadota bacterium]